jgi:transposase InsO family protein
MHDQLSQHRMKALCQALQLSRSGYYAWHKRKSRTKPLLIALSQAFASHQARAGAPSLHHELQAQGFEISERSVGRALAKLGLRAKGTRKFRPAGSKKHHLSTAPNLLGRQFAIDKPNQVWVTDITYIRTSEGWLYLAVMIDLHSRLVVGWQMDTRMEQHLVCDALQAALLVRGKPKGVMIHSDQGSQYCSKAFRKLLDKHELTQSMSRRGNCWDNAVAESFFATLKKAVIYGQPLQSREQTRNTVFEFIESYYNRVRRHSNNGWLSPAKFEQAYYQSLEGIVV